MFFASDNWAGAHPEIAASLSHHAAGFAAAYGTSDLDRAIEQRFNEIFEREVAVFFVGTGTAANALALATINRPGGVSFCHRESHVIEDECGAPEFFTHGARLVPVDGPDGKMDPNVLVREIERFPADFVHHGQPMAVSITQATEIGTVYAPDEIDAIAAVCRGNSIPLHMDGARFANALVSLDMSPADMTWKRGVDIMSFGATKNGCWCAEALVVFDPGKARDLPFIRKRAAQLFSKTRFISAQFEAYFADGLWLDLARHANVQAQKLKRCIEQSSKIRLAWQPQANEVFAVASRETADRLREKGCVFAPWNPPRSLSLPLEKEEVLMRLVTSFATTDEHVDRFADLAI